MLYYNDWLSNSASHYMSWVLCFHDMLMGMMIFIGVLVFGLMVMVWSSHNVFISYIHDEPLEVAWTVFPMSVFLFLAFPSISLLYLGDKSEGGSTSTNYVKAVAHQWYWEYEQFMTQMNSEVKWDSFMVPILSLNPGDFNLLEVDKPILMPLEKTTNFLVTSADVLHSFAMPSFGMKVDCVPGRINQTFVQPMSLGVYYGQCSEICGANHSFMPISVEVHHE